MGSVLAAAVLHRTPSRFAVLFSLLAALAFSLPGSAAEDVNKFSPVAVESFLPLPEDLPLQEEPILVEPIELPEHRPVDEATWRQLKADAEVNPHAMPPQAVVPTTRRPEASFPRFPGQGRNEGGLTPPDTTLARGETRILQAVNSSIALYDTNGNLLERRSLANFFGAPVASPPNIPFPPFDPKVLFDRNAVNRRFFAVATQFQTNPDVGQIWLAVSRSTNPANLAPANWCRYWISATNDFGTSYATFPDQPKIGVGADSFVISADQFRITPSIFTFVVIRAFQKLGLENNATTCPTAIASVFRPAEGPGQTNIMSLHPVLHYNSPSSFPGTLNPVYLINADTPSSNIYHVWRIKDPAGAGGPGQLQVVDATGSAFDLPPDAPQSGTVIKLETFDSRIEAAQAFDNSLWAAHSTVCNSGGGATEACLKVVRINVGQDASGNPTASIGQDLTIGSGVDGVFYWMPGIAVNNTHRTALAFLLSSPTTFLSSAWTAKNAGATIYPAAQIFGTGTCARPLEFNKLPRTGDYVGVHTAPDLSSFLLSVEHSAIDPPGGGICTWKTEIL